MPRTGSRCLAGGQNPWVAGAVPPPRPLPRAGAICRKWAALHAPRYERYGGPSAIYGNRTAVQAPCLLLARPIVIIIGCSIAVIEIENGLLSAALEDPSHEAAISRRDLWLALYSANLPLLEVFIACFQLFGYLVTCALVAHHLATVDACQLNAVVGRPVHFIELFIRATTISEDFSLSSGVLRHIYYVHLLLSF
ncbi:hypothetical protein NDU88_006910 [Pleurodeles waltl]|uniref:Uncharacterized protein n=1 Tax=Pleurodeles waltl TaxID=8319 RepID=A0AAV7LS51_PLEWA|nr:hypothetical protein NDU88_006910 [Pleurodeles waltl]